MRVALGWLAEWIGLPDSSDELVERLTVGGLELEGIERIGPDLGEIRVGEVVERRAHPNADRLAVCLVDVGDAEPVEVVCGAPNVAAGQKIAFAATGTLLPDGTKLKRSKIRGVVSNGMICSARELGLGDDHAGILVLDPSAQTGAPLAQALPSGDTVLDFEITPNRGDWASMLGIAREVRAHFGGNLRLPDCAVTEGSAPVGDFVRGVLEDPEGCPLYLARVVRGVTNGPSPDWLAQRLEAAGLRSVNAVVDVTNLVLLEFGQPLHAFDLSAIHGPEIRVRRAEAGEKIETLDGVTRELQATDLAIADAERPVAVAGVMGGAATEVGLETTELLIESALFHPVRVRRTARRLGLHSDASYRFERGVDPQGVRRAADRAARLITELCGGEVARGVIELRGTALPVTREVRLDPARVNRLLGTELGREQVKALLARVDMPSREEADGSLVAQVPSYRNDVQRAEDLVEEVARIHGYDRIPTTLPLAELRPAGLARRRSLAERARSSLAAQGMSECVTPPFASRADWDRLGLAPEDPRRQAVEVLNPFVEESSILRTLVLPSLLRAVQGNQNRQVEEQRLFEIAPAFLAGGGEDGLPAEPWLVTGVFARGNVPALWQPREPIPLFFLAKGVAERVLFDLGYAAWFRAGSEESAQAYLHPGAATGVGVGERVIGSVGELHPEAAARFGVAAPCALFEFDLSALLELSPRVVGYQEVSRQPRVQRDLAVLLDRDCAAGEVLEAIRESAGAQLVSAEIFDRYEGRGVPEGKLSVAFRLVFQRHDRTLKDTEIAKMTDRVVRMLAQRFGGELR